MEGGTAANSAAARPPDERVREVGFARRLFTRPEMGAVAGALLAWLFFAIVAGDSGFLDKGGFISWLEVAAELAIIAVPVAMLMIAGEFDLSVGSMIGGAGVLIAIPLTEYQTPLWIALLLAVAAAVLVGVLNGYVVVRTGLPSFIVTLAALFMVSGLTLALTRSITGRTQVGGVKEEAGDTFLIDVFGGKIFGDYPVSIVWALVITAIATFVLLRTQFGNWIYGAGGDPDAARNVGVPVARVKIVLFVCTALGATLLAAIQVLQAGSADVLRGQLKELEAIAAAVIGGTLLTGGYGSAIGAFFGALLFGIVSQGIFFTDIDTDWFKVFLGSMILAAVLVNRYIRQKAQDT